MLEDDSNSWPCFECSQAFASSEELQRHLNEHENIAPPNGQTASVAPSTLMVEEELHKKRIKVMLPQVKQENNGKIRHKCPICPRVFDRQYSLQRHVALHKGDKKFKCDQCHARYSLRFNLNRHKRQVHGNADRGNYVHCNICGLWFCSRSTYRIHSYSHDHQYQVSNKDLEDLKCSQCLMKFIHWEDHVSHATTHGESLLPFENIVIQEQEQAIPGIQGTSETASLTNLRKPHKCELCYKSFSTEERLMVREREKKRLLSIY